MIPTMKTITSPFLSKFEEASPANPTVGVLLEEEVTFVGKVYKSVLLDTSSDGDRNPITIATKVGGESTDEQ